MILQVMEKEGRYRVLLEENGMETEYDASLHVCASPVCICGVVDMELTPVPVEREAGEQIPVRIVPVDVVRKKLAKKGGKKSGPERDFANALIKQLDEEDFQFLTKRYLAAKKNQTEKARPQEIDAFFEYDKIEEEGLLTTYNDVLPYADQILVTLNGETCVVFDQYCLRNGCSCNDALLDIFLVDQEKAGGGKEIGCFFVDYRKKKWWTEDGSRGRRGFVDLTMARQCIEEQLPSIYSLMKERHVRLTKIYNHCLRKKYGIESGAAHTARVGRNEPCPCGSGKKYKKCCLGK
jgi:hypothetical protein